MGLILGYVYCEWHYQRILGVILVYNIDTFVLGGAGGTREVEAVECGA